jgi:hypothetical protein
VTREKMKIEIVSFDGGREVRENAPNLKLALQWAAKKNRRYDFVQSIQIDGFAVIQLPNDRDLKEFILKELAGYSDHDGN